MKTKLTFTKLNPSNKYNMINPNEGERMGNYEIQKSIVDKWEYTNETSEETSGNINHELNFEISEGKIKPVYNSSYWDLENVFSFSQIITSQLLLYRCICLFFGAPLCKDNYKAIWWYTIKHKETGRLLMFSEWKGAAGFWLNEYSTQELTKELKKDLEELLIFILSDQIAHPYDGCTAGQIA